MAGLVELGIEDNEISDIGALRDLSDLKILKAAGNNISDLGVLAHLKKLRTTEIDRNPAVEKMQLNLKEGESQLDAVRATLEQG